jgi:hypothetical protein
MVICVLYAFSVNEFHRQSGYGLDFRDGEGFFSLRYPDWPGGPTQASAQGKLNDPCPGVERLGREAEHSPLTRAQIKKAWSYTSNFPRMVMACCLTEHGGSFYYQPIDLSVPSLRVDFNNSSNQG